MLSYGPDMPRLSIDVTDEQHRRLKAIAALRGQSLKDYVLSRSLDDTPDTNDMTEDQAMQSLYAFLEQRLAGAKAENRSNRTIARIAEAARNEFLNR